MANILVVDDELGIRDLLSEILSDEGHHVDLAENATQARNARLANSYDLVLLDIWMPDTDGITLLREWASGGQLTMPVIMMSGHATIETAVEATRIGAMSFLEKPITLQRLLKEVEQGINKRKAMLLQQSLAQNGQEPGLPSSDPGSPYPLRVAGQTPHEPAAALSPEQGFNLDQPLRQARDNFEKAYFEFHLARESGSMTRVAEKTGLERTHLYRKLRQLGVDLGRNRKN